MGDSATALWESELLRARQWLAASRRDRQNEQERLFQRVKSHIGFKDHEHSLQSEAVPSDDDDLSLDFLADVDASSAMSALLQAEAGTQPPPVEESAMPSAADLLKPLEMPRSLASPKLKPAKPVPMSQLDPKVVTGATLGSDAAVDNLMQDLSLEVPHSEAEETKTEDSTPPHLLKSFGVVEGKVKAAADAVQAQDVRQASESPQQLQKAAAAAAKKPDEVEKEMLSWVTGYRDPEVVRRKESMARRKRKHTHLYGVSSEQERQEVLMRVKEITRDSNSDSGSESEDDMSSDYSPAEDEEVPEPDEPEVVDLLSDDYLDSDEDKRPVKRKRKRLRQAETAQKKKKARSRKPAVTHKLEQPGSSGKTTAQAKQTQASVGAAVNASEQAPAVSKVNSTQPIEVLSSGDEAGNSDQSGAPIPGSLRRKSSADAASDKATESAAAKGSTILRLKIPKDFRQTPSEAGADAVALAPVASGATAQHNEKLDRPAGKVEATSTPSDMNTEADGADLSDTGTVDLEAEDLSVGNEEKTDDAGDAAAGSGVQAGSGIARAQEEIVASAEGESNKAESGASAEAASSGVADDDDVSEAETEILEDDEPETDDLGLDYSDDSDSGDKSVGGSDKKASGSKTGSAASPKDSKGDAASSSNNAGDSASDTKQKAADANGADKASASAAGVLQFFDFVPLKLKPKSKSTTSTAPKPLPVHDYDETHSKKVVNGKTSAEAKKPVATPPPQSSAGSNGLRPSKKPIATTTKMKGKYAQTRRSTKMLDPEDAPGAPPKQRNHYTMVPTQKAITMTGSNDLDDVPLAILAKELSKTPEDLPNGRYLSYAGAKKTEDAPSYATKTPSIVPKSRFGGGTAFSSSTPAAKEPPQVTGRNGSNGYLREPQISIYDALHVEGQESASNIREGTGFKRPNRFKKMQEEAARNGTPRVKSRLQDTDWDKVPIPKKKKQALSPDKPTHQAPRKFSSKNERGPSNTPGKNQTKRRKKNSGPPKSSGPSYYGPQASQAATKDKYESPSRGHRGKENGNSRNGADRRRTRSPSPPFRERDRHSRDGRYRDDRRRRGSSRSRSRSPSPRGRDYGKDHYRRRSRSRSRSKERSHERDRRSESSSNDRDRDRDASDSKRSLSPDRQGSSKSNGFGVPSAAPELGEVHQNGSLGDGDRSLKKQKPSYDVEEPASPGALATFDDDGDNMFISDSDDDGAGLIKEVEDIRFDLQSVPVDEALMAKQVYVTGFNPTVSAEQIEEDFARFGVAVSDTVIGFVGLRCKTNFWRVLWAEG
jgi:hypothetical protein